MSNQDETSGLSATTTDTSKYLRDPLCPAWTRLTQRIHNGCTMAVTFLALSAARRPLQTIAALTLVSLALPAVGYASGNFRLELDIQEMFASPTSRPKQHSTWIKEESGFNVTRNIMLFFHNDGHNVLNAAQTRRVLEATDIIQSTPGFEDLCRKGSYVDFNDQPNCRIWSVSEFWQDPVLETFDATVRSDLDVQAKVAQKQFASGAPIFHDAVLGNWEKRILNTTGEAIMISAQSYFVHVDIPDLGKEADMVEEKIVSELDSMRRQWIQEDASKPDGDPTRLVMDLKSASAYQTEAMEMIFDDMYLVAVAAMFVIVFTCMVFYRHDPEQAASRTLLGIASILSITMSLLAGCGIMFLAGIPWTTCTQMLPYVIYGVGLDDTFIITGAYFQLPPGIDDVEERIRLTMKQIGWSISLTTTTTVVAFIMGAVSSSFPGIVWLCLYSFTVIIIVFFYQVTYFVALLVLDERRVAANRRDGICCFFTRNGAKLNSDDDNGVVESSLSIPSAGTKAHLSVQERFMKWYSSFLLRPPVKTAVLVLFTTLFGVCMYNGTKVEQSFELSDYVPDDSYLKSFTTNVARYSSVVRPLRVYFRDVDQTSPEMQQQMRKYIEDLEGLEQVGSLNDMTKGNRTGEAEAELRPFCWVRDFEEFERTQLSSDPFVMATLENMTFLEKLDFALADKTVRAVYGQDIARDPDTGNITASSCTLILRNLDMESVTDQIDFLQGQREVAAAQEVNEDRENWAFFSFDLIFFLWEASSTVINEMVFTSVAGIIAVSVVAFVFVPHWTASFFVVPLICVLYIDLLGAIRLFGLTINPVSYVCVVVSIGLSVDFLIHILLRYFEATPGKSRDARVKETLETMGASILVGGLTTFLAAVPIAFSSAAIFMTVFYSFFAIVILGVAHGLILLPVLLSYLGPSVSVHGHSVVLEPVPRAKMNNNPETPRTIRNDE